MVRALLSNLLKVSLVAALLIVIAHTISDAMQEQRPNTIEVLATRNAAAPATALPQLVDLNEPEEEGVTHTDQMLLIFRDTEAEATPEPLVYTALTKAELERANDNGLWRETGLTDNPIVAFSNLVLLPTPTPTYIRPTLTPSPAATITPRPTGVIIVQDNNPESAENQEQQSAPAQAAAQPQPEQPPVAANPNVGEAISAPPTEPPPLPTSVPPTAVPPTPVPPTPVPPTPVPPTPVPPTPVPPTSEPPPPVIEQLPPQLLPPNNHGELGGEGNGDDNDEGDRRSERNSNRGRGRGSGRGS